MATFPLLLPPLIPAELWTAPHLFGVLDETQGQSVRHVEIDLWIQVSSHKQPNMVLSCATCNQNVKIPLPDDQVDL